MKKNIYIYIIESFCYTAEIKTTLYIIYISILINLLEPCTEKKKKNITSLFSAVQGVSEQPCS